MPTAGERAGMRGWVVVIEIKFVRRSHYRRVSLGGGQMLVRVKRSRGVLVLIEVKAVVHVTHTDKFEFF